MEPIKIPFTKTVDDVITISYYMFNFVDELCRWNERWDRITELGYTPRYLILSKNTYSMFYHHFTSVIDNSIMKQLMKKGFHLSGHEIFYYNFLILQSEVLIHNEYFLL